MFDGGNGGANSGVVGDVLVVVERDVEVGPDEDLLPLQVRRAQLPHALLRHRHHPPRALSSSHRRDARCDIRREQRVRRGEAQAARERARAEGGGELHARGGGGGGGGGGGRGGGVEERESCGGCG